MKSSSPFQINFANAFADLYLNKENGEFAIDFRRQEITVYLNSEQYGALALLMQQVNENEELMSYVKWTTDPLNCSDDKTFEICGPNHIVCLASTPNLERVKLTFDIGIAIDLGFNDFQGFIELILEAQSDFEWRRELLKWNNEDQGQDFLPG